MTVEAGGAKGNSDHTPNEITGRQQLPLVASSVVVPILRRTKNVVQVLDKDNPRSNATPAQPSHEVKLFQNACHFFLKLCDGFLVS